MVGDDTLGSGAFRRSGDAADSIQGGKDGTEDLRFIAAGFSLKDSGDTLKAHTGIHIALGKRFKSAVGLLVVLHKDVIPDLDPEFVGGANGGCLFSKLKKFVWIGGDTGSGIERGGWRDEVRAVC